MTKHVRVWTVVVLSMAVVFSMPAVSSNVLAAGPDASMVEDAIGFREDFGLRHDHDFVEATFDDPKFSDVDWGVPLNDDELQDLARRVRSQQAITGVLDWANKSEDSGGVYLDQKRDGRPVFLVANHVAEFKEELEERMPGGADYDVEVVDRTLARLTATKDRISDDWDVLRKQGVYLIYVQVDVPR